MSKILIIDDDEGICRLLKGLIGKSRTHESICAMTLGEGRRVLEGELIDLVFLDVVLPDGNSLEHIGRIMSSASQPEVIVMTGASHPEDAEHAIQNGAWDYLQKPFDPAKVLQLLNDAVQFHTKKMERAAVDPIQFDGIIGSSAALQQALAHLAQAACTDGNVLITGETGTGKELFAQALHRNSVRKGNFVVLDCAALPENLVASVLFGHVKGAFTGADTTTEGLAKQADGGTLFLDEVGEMPLSIQKAFLRVLESRRFRPIGAKQEMASDFRLVSSTHRDLDAMAQKGTFRRDLLFRLRSFHIHLPPVRDRGADIMELAEFHLKRFCTLYQLPPKSLAPDFRETITAYDWPGNVRELVNSMARAIGAARHDATLYSVHLPRELRTQVVVKRIRRRPEQTRAAIVDLTAGSTLPSLQTVRDSALSQAESCYLNRLLSTTESVTKACALSGLSRSRFYELLKKYDLRTRAVHWAT